MKLRLHFLLPLVALLPSIVGAQLAPQPFDASAAAMRERALMQLQFQLELDRLRQFRDWQMIYSAYPDNPTLWRYLDRNPRYIPYYLGR